ncbi:hypothetical protein [Paraburkholderia sp. CNPSo 3076]|uniref:hypothetical protein n=1 Tax=Paraburkholderia sp. CNPSo 3076 TaxID=2940936 RepID=UPI003A520F8B
MVRLMMILLGVEYLRERWRGVMAALVVSAMAWTPGLTLDYARALSMLADPRPSGWTRMLRSLRASMLRRERRKDREQRREVDHDGRSPHA